MITVGNKENSTTSAYQSPGKGCLDQVAFWNSELTEGQITAQFNALPHSGLSANFDLTHWELMLPVNSANQLGSSGIPLVISAGWLNSGCEYIDPDPMICLKKYFYMGTDGGMVFDTPSNGAVSGAGRVFPSEQDFIRSARNSCAEVWQEARFDKVHLAGSLATSENVVSFSTSGLDSICPWIGESTHVMKPGFASNRSGVQ